MDLEFLDHLLEGHSYVLSPSSIIGNGDPNLAWELPSARGRRFTQSFTNNFALQSTYALLHVPRAGGQN